MLGLAEIQDILTQMCHITDNELVGYSHLPRFIATKMSARLSGDSSMVITN